jgi:hypothetical protein
MNRTHALVAFATLVLAALPPRAAAAETHHRCTGFIDALPAVITAPGIWCLRGDLSTSISAGTALHIEASNATLDCNGYRVNGLVPSWAYGISAESRSNVTVRNCAVIGFFYGVRLLGGHRYLVEDSRTDNVRGVGIWVQGDQSIVRRNRISDVGSGASGGFVAGIVSSGYGSIVAENQIADVTAPDAENGEALGISTSGAASRVENNHITSILPNATGLAYGIRSTIGNRSVYVGNTIINLSAVSGYGFSTPGGSAAPVCQGNVVRGFATSSFDDCIDAGGNYGG